VLLAGQENSWIRSFGSVKIVSVHDLIDIRSPLRRRNVRHYIYIYILLYMLSLYVVINCLNEGCVIFVWSLIDNCKYYLLVIFSFLL
jgi:hypothetical protein